MYVCVCDVSVCLYIFIKYIYMIYNTYIVFVFISSKYIYLHYICKFTHTHTLSLNAKSLLRWWKQRTSIRTCQEGTLLANKQMEISLTLFIIKIKVMIKGVSSAPL